MSRSSWLWPIIIIISAIAVGLASFADYWTQIRPLLAFWFLLICPGMAFVRLLKLKDGFAEWTLAIALSLALDTIMAGIMSYAGLWEPKLGLAVLIAVSLFGSLLQIVLAYVQETPAETQMPVSRSRLGGAMDWPLRRRNLLKAIIAGLGFLGALFLMGMMIGWIPGPSRLGKPQAGAYTSSQIAVADTFTQTNGVAAATPSTPQPTDNATLFEPATPTAVPTATPLPVVQAEPCNVPPPAWWVQYTIQLGDTFNNLAAERGTGVHTIRQINCLENKDLKVGLVLWLPPFR